MQQIQTLADFGTWLAELIARLERQGRGAQDFANMQLVTGLRAIEVLEFSRWSVVSPGVLQVQLAKREATRQFQRADLPAPWLARLEAFRAYHLYTYASYIHDLKGVGISFIFNGDRRKTISHAFRYYRFRALYDQLGSVADVQLEMCHKSRGSTMYYLLDTVSVNDAKG